MKRDSASRILEALREIDPYDFEYFVASLWEHRGWDAEVSSGARDAGIDVIAERSDPFPQTQVIQAKRYSAGNKIGSADVQQYASLRRLVDGADTVVIVTTSEFTSDAETRAEELNVKLVDGDGLLQFIDDSGAHCVVEEYTDVEIDGATQSESTEESTGDGLDSDQATEADHEDSRTTAAEAIRIVLQGLLALVLIGLVAYLTLRLLVL